MTLCGRSCLVCSSLLGAAIVLLSWVIQAKLNAAIDHLESFPQPHSYEELTRSLGAATHLDIPVEAANGISRGRNISVFTSPLGQSGKTFILLHGFKMRAVTWSGVWNLLLFQGHQVVAIDLPGHGSSPLASKLDLATLSNDLRLVLRALSVTNGALVAHSLGGLIALDFALRFPDDARDHLPGGLACVACTAGGWPDYFPGSGGNWHGYLLMQTGLFDLLMESDSIATMLMAKKFGKRPSAAAVRVVVDASRHGSPRRKLKALSDLPWMEDLRPSLSSLPIPSLVVVGSLEDHHPHPRMSLDLRASLAESGKLRGYVELEGVGHYVPLVKPEELVEALHCLWQGGIAEGPNQHLQDPQGLSPDPNPNLRCWTG